MDIYEIEEFCDRWLDKADRYQTDALEDLFDKFYTLFVPYNRLYSTAAMLYRSTMEERERRQHFGDRREATTIMAILIRPSRFSETISNNPELLISCRTISTLLQEHQLFLHTIRSTREPDLARDVRLADGLDTGRLLSVLECLYQIRCNIFHGEKQFVARQSALMVPAINLLEAIVNLGRQVLREIASEQPITRERRLI